MEKDAAIRYYLNTPERVADYRVHILEVQRIKDLSFFIRIGGYFFDFCKVLEMKKHWNDLLMKIIRNWKI